MTRILIKWVAIALAVIIVALLALRFFFAEQMGEAGFKRAVDAVVSSNTLAELDDGLHVVLVGTGSPLPDPMRAGPSTAVIAGGKIYIVDSGGGSVRKMGELRLPIGRVEAVFLTHFHSDHIDGLGELMLQRWAGGGRDMPLPVYGPDGVQQIVDGLNTVYAQDTTYRIAHHGETVVPPSGQGGAALPFDAPTGAEAITVLEDGDLRVTAFRVSHAPVDPAVGYRFDYKGRSVTFSGDTKRDSTLALMAKETDILIHEALNTEMVGVLETALREAGNDRTAKIMADIPDYHATPVEAAQTATEANAGALVFSHIVPAVPSKALYPYYLKGTGAAYAGPIIMGEDGMMFSLPANGDGMTRSRLD